MFSIAHVPPALEVVPARPHMVVWQPPTPEEEFVEAWSTGQGYHRMVNIAAQECRIARANGDAIDYAIHLCLIELGMKPADMAPHIFETSERLKMEAQDITVGQVRAAMKKIADQVPGAGEYEPYKRGPVHEWIRPESDRYPRVVPREIKAPSQTKWAKGIKVRWTPDKSFVVHELIIKRTRDGSMGFIQVEQPDGEKANLFSFLPFKDAGYQVHSWDLMLDEQRKVVKLDVPALIWTEQNGKWRKISQVEATRVRERQVPATSPPPKGEPKRVLPTSVEIRLRSLRYAALGTGEESKAWEIQKMEQADTPSWHGKRRLVYVSEDLVQEWIAELVDIIREKVRSGDEETYRVLEFHHELSVLDLPDGGRIELPPARAAQPRSRIEVPSLPSVPLLTSRPAPLLLPATASE